MAPSFQRRASGGSIPGAMVKVEIGSEALEGKSDSSGKWAVSGLGKGQFFAEFSKSGFETKRVRLMVEKETIRLGSHQTSAEEISG